MTNHMITNRYFSQLIEIVYYPSVTNFKPILCIFCLLKMLKVCCLLPTIEKEY